eukprot:1964726-Rhodomonas_salina.5
MSCRSSCCRLADKYRSMIDAGRKVGSTSCEPAYANRAGLGAGVAVGPRHLPQDHDVNGVRCSSRAVTR